MYSSDLVILRNINLLWLSEASPRGNIHIRRVSSLTNAQIETIQVLTWILDKLEKEKNVLYLVSIAKIPTTHVLPFWQMWYFLTLQDPSLKWPGTQQFCVCWIEKSYKKQPFFHIKIYLKLSDTFVLLNSLFCYCLYLAYLKCRLK